MFKSIAELHAISVNNSASLLFRKRIKELRKRRQWTQEQAAEACGIDYKLYQFYELGIKDNPGLQTLEKISAGFGLPLNKLFSRTPQKRSEKAQQKGKK